MSTTAILLAVALVLVKAGTPPHDAFMPETRMQLVMFQQFFRKVLPLLTGKSHCVDGKCSLILSIGISEETMETLTDFTYNLAIAPEMLHKSLDSVTIASVRCESGMSQVASKTLLFFTHSLIGAAIVLALMMAMVTAIAKRGQKTHREKKRS